MSNIILVHRKTFRYINPPAGSVCFVRPQVVDRKSPQGTYEKVSFSLFFYSVLVSLICHPTHFLPSSFLFPLSSSPSMILEIFITSPHLSFCATSCQCFHSPFFLSSPLPHPLFSFLRLSPIWEVSEHALRAVASSRLCSLAQPRAPVAGWRQDRLPLAPVSNACLIS